MKKVVITGATSLVGIALIDECIANNVNVLALVRKNSSKISGIPQSPLVTVAECGLDDLCDFSYNEADFDVFYHFGWSHTDKQGRMSPILQQENIRFSVDAVDLAKRLGCKKFVGAGSQAEYGTHIDGITSPASPLFPQEAYGVAKAAVGRLCAIEAERLGLLSVWVRIFSLYGKYELESTLIQTTIRKMLAGERCSFSPCEHKWDFLYSSDAGKALLKIGQNTDKSTVYCLGSGKSQPLYKYIEEMKSVLKSNSVLGFGDIAYPDSVPTGFCADISSLTADTGWCPSVSFADGISATAKIINNNQNISK